MVYSRKKINVRWNIPDQNFCRYKINVLAFSSTNYAVSMDIPVQNKSDGVFHYKINASRDIPELNFCRYDIPVQNKYDGK